MEDYEKMDHHKNMFYYKPHSNMDSYMKHDRTFYYQPRAHHQMAYNHNNYYSHHNTERSYTPYYVS